jgi:hypothetical protein
MISPSNLERRMMCPGSELAELGLADRPGPNALEGTRKHKILELWVGWLRDGALAFPPIPHSSLPTESDLEWVRETMLPIINGALNDSRTVLAEENLSFYLNKELHMNRDGDPDRCKADLVILGNDNSSAVVYDYKFGMDVADPATDLQMISYAIGVREKYGCEEVVVVKINARFKKIIEATLTGAELDAYKIQIRKAVDDAYEDHAVRIAGEKQCKYCRARATCREREEYEAKKISNEHITSTTKEVKNVPDFLGLSPAERGAFLSALDESIVQYKELRESIEGFSIGSHEKGKPLAIDGYAIGEGRRSREWKNEIEATLLLARIARDRGADVNSIYEPQKLLSPAGAEKIFTGAPDKINIGSQAQSISGKMKLLKNKN